MADWKALIMKDGEKQWKARPVKPAKDPTPDRRAKVVAGIDKTIKQLSDPNNADRLRWYKVKGDLAQVTVRLGSRPLSLEGSETQVYVPAERASDFYKAIRGDVEAGKFDDAIRDLFNKDGEDRASARKGRKIAPWSPERRARFEAKQKAKG
ncbi:MAG: hypothetical protein BGP16_00985 [Sphingobium sp. 66-54]|nr:MAG: hypothetical protein BGP16_00985 [Sphingobium sp. 66-54]